MKFKTTIGSKTFIHETQDELIQQIHRQLTDIEKEYDIVNDKFRKIKNELGKKMKLCKKDISIMKTALHKLGAHKEKVMELVSQAG